MNFWHFPPARSNALCKEIAACNPKIVLDIGANAHYRLPLATHTVGWEGDIQIDLCHDELPFEDGEVDYVFSRHTIEDLADPEPLLAEIRRVAKRGYLETPSIHCELSRNVDAIGTHRGYVHHRWLCGWHNDRFTCIAKYPCIESIGLRAAIPLLEDSYEAWNFCHRFEGPLEYAVLQNERGFALKTWDGRGQYPIEYFDLVLEAM